jgi:S-DNA-T family DNA segregation ATPase FtsK/SpoIIIE
MLLSILYKATPEDVKLILVDPKRLELGLYQGIPHLVTPIITDPKVAANALRNGVKEMERRLKLLAEKGVRNIEQYTESLNLFEPQEEQKRLPYIVIFIDELADLMMVDSNSVELSITRLAQMARAVGIHLVLATQRPSVDVITGLIKANFPARISFRVATKVDSRTILDSNGSEALLGKGDMLFSPPGSGRLVRVHGPLVTEAEICQVVDFWRSQAAPSYSEEFLRPPPAEDAEEPEEEWTAERDELYEQAVRVVVEMGKASTSILQRRLRLGYGRAARLLDVMEKDGIIGPPDGSKPREVLKRADWFAELERSRTGV